MTSILKAKLFTLVKNSFAIMTNKDLGKATTLGRIIEQKMKIKAFPTHTSTINVSSQLRQGNIYFYRFNGHIKVRFISVEKTSGRLRPIN